MLDIVKLQLEQTINKWHTLREKKKKVIQRGKKVCYHFL